LFSISLPYLLANALTPTHLIIRDSYIHHPFLEKAQLITVLNYPPLIF
jgi:hypothetical protein